ncbi:MAG: YfhO family protein [Verrucomicrobia bacterium]|nr:YfhO family protein [Verrucomicrobiota bacterium]
MKIEKYSPTRMELTINTDAPAILMTTDKWDPDWHVSVNGQQKPLLHCDFLMRGVYLEPSGQPQTVVFHYAPPRTPLIVSIIALATGLGLLGFSLALPGRSQSTTASP